MTVTDQTPIVGTTILIDAMSIVIIIDEWTAQIIMEWIIETVPIGTMHLGMTRTAEEISTEIITTSGGIMITADQTIVGRTITKETTTTDILSTAGSFNTAIDTGMKQSNGIFDRSNRK